jgi:hypothetical protein
MSERRYTDEEVARLLQRAADLDRDSGAPTLARGLSLTELRDIAAEAGIDPGMVTRAASEIPGRGTRRPTEALLGGSGVVGRTAAFPGRMDREALGRLVEIVDAESPEQGTVGEALGSIRWTSKGRFLSRQVVLRPGESESVVRVEERYTPRARAVIHLIPMTYAAGAGLAAGAQFFAAGAAQASAAVGAALAGFGLGRAIWTFLRARSARRVEGLLEKLSEEAAHLSAGDPAP